jgi:hypothetical protein
MIIIAGHFHHHQEIVDNKMKLTYKYIIETFNNFTPEQWDLWNKAMIEGDRETIATLMGVSTQEMDKDFVELYSKVVVGTFV